MVAGRLQEKNRFFYMVLSYTGADDKRKQPWMATGLPVKGNKKRAEQMLRDLRRSFMPPKAERSEELSPDMLFGDYMLYWLKIIRPAVQETTWSSYCFNVKDHMRPKPKKYMAGYYTAEEIVQEKIKQKQGAVNRLHSVSDSAKAAKS